MSSLGQELSLPASVNSLQKRVVVRAPLPTVGIQRLSPGRGNSSIRTGCTDLQVRFRQGLTSILDKQWQVFHDTQSLVLGTSMGVSSRGMAITC